MSPLTKLFVVLLVILSMLNAAAEVVFVNKVRPLQEALSEKEAVVQTAQAEAHSARIAQQSATDQLQAQVALRADDHKATAAAVTQLQNQLNSVNEQLAQLQADKTTRDSTISQLSSNLTLQTATVNKLQEQTSALQAANDGLVRRTEEDSRRIADLTNTGETLQTQLNTSQEKLQAALVMVQRLSGIASKNGVDVAALEQAPTGPASVAISGTVVEKQSINGNSYLRINVGSEQGVTKGTTFNVLSSGNFAGILTIDEVDSQSASGKFIAEPGKGDGVRSGDVVKTLLRGS
ncbi:MAG: hypothetical protein M3O30_10600 [Planctomycetota bacterium]|nr:hypothetical protein [Planctomycetota bacterium]